MIVDSKVIAVDFDGTIVEDKYPRIGKPMPFAFETLKLIVNDGHRLVLWTVREGSKLEEAVMFCKEHGVEFYAVNESFPGESKEIKHRKLNADIFIDDRNIMGFPGWGEIYQYLTGKNELPKHTPKTRKGLLGKLFS